MTGDNFAGVAFPFIVGSPSSGRILETDLLDLGVDLGGEGGPKSLECELPEGVRVGVEPAGSSERYKLEARWFLTRRWACASPAPKMSEEPPPGGFKTLQNTRK